MMKSRLDTTRHETQDTGSLLLLGLEVFTMSNGVRIHYPRRGPLYGLESASATPWNPSFSKRELWGDFARATHRGLQRGAAPLRFLRFLQEWRSATVLSVKVFRVFRWPDSARVSDV
jgi:hypothetical protein